MTSLAIVADVHGNLAALEAVLAEIEHEGFEAIVVAGDVAGGPEQRATLARLRGLENAQVVRGNVDRVIVQAYDEQWSYAPDAPLLRKVGGWAAGQLTRQERDFLAGFEDRVVVSVEGLGDVLVCHGSPRSDDEIMTSITPESVLAPMLTGIEARVVVCGHTHVQFDRTVGETRVVNAGSVGMPYEGRRGAFWVALGPDVGHRRTEYDVDEAAERIRASDYWDAEETARGLVEPPDPREMEALFESYPR
jgi:putative phosphoesterase